MCLISLTVLSYAPVICNHSPLSPRGGGIQAEEMCNVFTFLLSQQYGGNARVLCYKGKMGSAIKHITDCGEGNCFTQLAAEAVWSFKSPLISYAGGGGGGVWLQVHYRFELVLSDWKPII